MGAGVPRPLLALAVVGLVALGACSDPADTLDQAATERAVGRAVAAEVEPTVTATRCAGSLEAAPGGTFSCKVTLQGAGTLSVAVRQTDDEGTLDAAAVLQIVGGTFRAADGADGHGHGAASSPGQPAAPVE